MLRRLAISLAATSALVLTATAPAIADHGPEPDDTKEGNLTCSDIDDLVFDEAVKVDPPVDVADGDGENFTATVIDDDDGDGEPDTDGDGQPDLLNVVAKDGFVIDAVLVKGGNIGSSLFLGPAASFTHLQAPDNPSGKPAAISHYEVCISEDEDGNGGDDDGNGGDDDGNGGDNGDGDGGDDNGGDDGSTSTPTPTPTPTETTTPAPVPTEVPAGASGSGDASSMAPVGIVAAALMVMAGGAALLRRRFAHQS